MLRVQCSHTHTPTIDRRKTEQCTIQTCCYGTLSLYHNNHIHLLCICLCVKCIAYFMACVCVDFGWTKRHLQSLQPTLLPLSSPWLYQPLKCCCYRINNHKTSHVCVKLYNSSGKYRHKFLAYTHAWHRNLYKYKLQFDNNGYECIVYRVRFKSCCWKWNIYLAHKIMECLRASEYAQS